MSWARFDDRYDDNRKVKRAWRKDPASVGLHAMAITYCARHHTDGVVDLDWIEEKLYRPAARKKAIAALEDAGLFVRIDDEHWMVNDYLEYNPSASESASRARDKAEAGRRGGLAKAKRKRIGEPLRQQIASQLGFAAGELGATKCGYCDEPITVDWTDPGRVKFLDRNGAATPEIDHIDPVSNHGAHEVSNLRLACLRCNRSKGASTHLAGGKQPPASKAAPVPSRPVPTHKGSASHSVEPSSTKPDPTTQQAADLFSYWQTQCGHEAAKPTRDRIAKVKARLREGYTDEQIRAGIDGAASQPFVNEAGKAFDDLELICRNGSKLEDFIARATHTPQRPASQLRAVASGYTQKELDRMALQAERRAAGEALLAKMNEEGRVA